MTVDCLLHVHSSFSYDSRTPLADIAAMARRNGYGCVLMSEHNNTLDQNRVDAFVRECEALSDDTLLMIPGLELAFDQNRVHLLAFGIRRFIASMAPECSFRELVAAVHDNGGLAVLAHPSHKGAIERVSADDLVRLDGIEVWNVKNGNKFCPDASELRALSNIRATAAQVWAFGGLDLHHPNKFVRLATRVQVARLDRDAVLEELRAGRFTTSGSLARVAPDGNVGALRLRVFGSTSNALKRTRVLAYRWQSRLERGGFKIPGVFAAIGRRLF